MLEPFLADLKAGDEEFAVLLDNICKKAADATTLKRVFSEQWESLWVQHGIAPRTPVEMSTWLAGFDKLRQQAIEVQSLQQECDRLQRRREELISGLLQVLKTMEVLVNEAKALEPVLIAAEAQLEKLLAATELARQLDRGEPILVGLRGEKDAALIDVEAMSTGTRDQLYLALRLATLKHRAESGHTMPFIVDDILVRSKVSKK
ncbi:MAG: hypothetical protein GQ559_04795 [Desulfobulbaceae bacterium]|nr:hypothetical protein [Desulfobulbaceae bacterium]